MFQLIGRLLFIAFFLKTGIEKVQKPQKESAHLISQYTLYSSLHHKSITYIKERNSHPLISQLLSTLDDIPSISLIDTHKIQITKGIGYTYLLASIVTLLCLPYLSVLACYVLALLSLSDALGATANTPMGHQKLQAFLQDLMLVGVALAITFSYNHQNDKKNKKQNKKEKRSNDYKSQKATGPRKPSTKRYQEEDKQKQNKRF